MRDFMTLFAKSGGLEMVIFVIGYAALRWTEMFPRK